MRWFKFQLNKDMTYIYSTILRVRIAWPLLLENFRVPRIAPRALSLLLYSSKFIEQSYRLTTPSGKFILYFFLFSLFLIRCESLVRVYPCKLWRRYCRAQRKIFLLVNKESLWTCSLENVVSTKRLLDITSLLLYCIVRGIIVCTGKV